MSRLFIKRLTFCALAPCMAISISAQAIELCEYGRLTFLEHPSGGTALRVAVVQGAEGYSRLKRKTGNTYATELEWNKDPMRWNNRFALLAQAHATQSRVSIYTTGADCIGSADEFEITLLD